jgi:HlyD family secretion protein
LSACNKATHEFDGSGTFEATDIMISSETNSKVLQKWIDKGQTIRKGDTLYSIDPNALKLQEAQVLAKLNTLNAKLAKAYPQTNILREQYAVAEANIQAKTTQLEILKKEKSRIIKLYESEAATEQQKDDISGKVAILEKQIEAMNKQLIVISTQIESAKQTAGLQNKALLSEREPIEAQLSIIQDQINKCIVKSPIDGTVLNTFAEVGEFTAMGKPLAKIADLTSMEFIAFISGDQLSQIQLDQNVQVFVDADKNNYTAHSGTVTWISDKAEFTPKSIQTKNERANLVYAVKVKLVNDGSIKIGMYGELSLEQGQSDDE